jgi:hypothetical protein
LPTGTEKYYLNMKKSIIGLGKWLAGASLAALTILAISSCGGGDGDGDATNPNLIAPESLSQVKINFFKAFTIECYRLGGTAGNETGAGDYNKLTDQFRYDDPDGLGWPITLPVSLQNLNYHYERTGLDTGRVTFTFTPVQSYPHPQANKDNTLVQGLGDMFWGGRGFLATSLIVDLLFVKQGGNLINSSARIRHLYIYESRWDGTNAVNTQFPKQFDATDVTFVKKDGAPVPAGYNPYLSTQDNLISDAVAKSLHLKDYEFAGAFQGLIAFRKGGIISGPDIPGDVRAEESGTILVTETDSLGEPVSVGFTGTYSYARTSGAYAKLAIQYDKTVGGNTTTVKENFVLQTLSLDNGSYTSSTGGLGTFQNNLYSP